MPWESEVEESRDAAGGGTGRQASRAISTARLNASLRLRPRPIEVVVYDRALGRFRREDLSWGRLGA